MFTLWTKPRFYIKCRSRKRLCMSLHEKTLAVSPYNYVGGELELFEKAVCWKAYFHRCLRSFLRGRVLEVGAGFGGTTRILCDGGQQSWTALEPDAELLV